MPIEKKQFKDLSPDEQKKAKGHALNELTLELLEAPRANNGSGEWKLLMDLPEGIDHDKFLSVIQEMEDQPFNGPAYLVAALYADDEMRPAFERAVENRAKSVTYEVHIDARSAKKTAGPPRTIRL